MNVQDFFNNIFLFIIQKLTEPFTSIYFFISHKFKELFHNLYLFIVQKFSELLTSIYFFINHNFMEPFDNLYLFIIQKFKELFTNIHVFINHDSHVISIQTSDGDSTCSSAIVESKEALLPTPYSHFISIKLDDEESSAGKSSRSKYSSSNTSETGKGKKIRRSTIPRPQVKREGIWLRHYCSNHNILLVGEGDFSFSACLAKAFGSATTMVATSLDSLEFLERNYPSAKSNIGCLKKSGCIVLHGVDATIMKLNISVNEFMYDRIIFNFPLAGFFKEPRWQTLKRNRKLVLSFMENASAMIASDGEIHITHKTSSLYREWGIENLAKKCCLRLIEDVEFKLTDYPGYHNKYGFGGNGNFDHYPSRTFKFCLK